MRDKELMFEQWGYNRVKSDEDTVVLDDCYLDEYGYTNQVEMLIGFDKSPDEIDKLPYGLPLLMYYRGKAYKITPLEDGE